MITFHSTSIMDTDAEALVCTVNCVGVMGKGLAKAVKERWPVVETCYRLACRRGDVKPGSIHVVDMHCGSSVVRPAPRYVLNFPTKRHWRDDSRMEDIESGLVDLINVVQLRQIKSVSVPALGCANGRLRWEDVKPEIVAACGCLPSVDWWIHEPL